MFNSLRAKLILSYAAIIFLCLLLAGSTLLVTLRIYQTKLDIARLADRAIPLSFQIRDLLRRETPLQEISTRLQEQAEAMEVRILLLNDNGRIIEDTQGDLRGRQVKLAQGPTVRNIRGSYYLGRYTLPKGRTLLFVALPAGPLPGAREGRLLVALATPQRGLLAAWGDLAPHLLWAGILALLVSVLVAFFISRSIALPLGQLTHASEGMAQGNYNQEIAVEGSDEVVRLAASFNKMAREVKRSQQMQRDFVANVSHELKTPLTSIQGFSQAMLDGATKGEEAYRRAAHIINEEAQRMIRLVSELLDLSQIESGQVAMAREPVDLAELLRRCVARFESRAKEAGLGLELDLPSPLTVLGDADRLERVFANLLDNAIKNTPEGGTISILARQGGPQAIEVTVADTGVGIPPEDLPRIFERFYRVDKSRAAGGTGLGLSIAKEIVEAHGGQIRVSSELGKGTQFVVALPTPASQPS